MDMLQEYLKFVEINKAKNTYENKVNTFKPFVNWLELEGKSLNDCTWDDVALYLKHRNDLSNRSLKQIIIEIKAMFHWYSKNITDEKGADYYMRENKRAKEIMDASISPFIEENNIVEKDSLTFENFEKLIKISRDQDKIVIYLLAYFGMKATEFVNELTESNIDKINGEVTVGKKTAAAHRTLYFDTEYTGKLIESYFDNRYKSRFKLNTMLNRYKDEVDTTPEKIRELFKTEMLKSISSRYEYPENLFFVERFMGHSLDSSMKGLNSKFQSADLKNIWLEYHYLNNYRLIDLPK